MTGNKKEFRTRVAGKEILIETGRMAKQASGSVVIRMGDTMVLCTVCAASSVRDGQDFFPLTVEYQEKLYAGGRIPGGYFKREGKLTEGEILTSRLIDRPIRPLFPEGFMNEVQLITTVMSQDKEHEANVLALIGASACLQVSELPFKEPVGAVRVGRINGELVFFPSKEMLKKSDMDILVAGTESSIIMVEGNCLEIDEKTMAETMFKAHKEIQALIQIQKELKAACGKPTMEWKAPERPQTVVDFVRKEFMSPLKSALAIAEKLKRYEAKDKVSSEADEKALAQFADLDAELVGKTVHATLEEMASEIMRKAILEEKRRIDGRDLTTVRPISIEVGVLPRAHGSVLFTRGETQALVACTLGAADDAQRLESLAGDYQKQFILHYNFPPFSVGETKPLRGPSRRDIGHGNLAEGALARMMPNQKEFPYTVRLVSEILESNGSSSMATVCGGSLALMDAGLPNFKPVAGIAMGLIAEGNRMEVLTDILGDEDHLGDMDFKVTGTRDGITGFQLDTKISGISLEVMERALSQARDARILILDKMKEALPESRKEMSPFAPKRLVVKVRQSKIKDVIGPGGKNIKSVVENTGAKIDINDDGTVQIFSTDPEMGKKAVEMIEALSGEIEVGKIYNGQVRKIVDFGAFVNIAPGTDGLLHISEIAEERVRRVEDYLQEGDFTDVKVLEIDRQGKIRLSRKEAMRERGVAEKA